jgi:CBS domain-containing protein
MTPTTTADSRTRLSLAAETAEALMTPNPVSIREDATVAELIALFAARGISAAPVIDEAGHPLGVVSRADVLIHQRERGAGPDAIRVGELMTPAVFSVRPDAPAARVVAELLAMRVHRLFVIDGSGALVGVISAIDVLRHLRPAAE